MYTEILELEVGTLRNGWEVIKPPLLTGKSRVNHKFSLLARALGRYLAFDVYDELGELEILRTFIKKLDTGASTFIVSMKGVSTETARRLAADYGIRILDHAEIEEFFNFPEVEIINTSEDYISLRKRHEST